MEKQYELTFLGTGTSQGIPVIGCTCAACISQDPRDRRLRCSIWIKSNHNNILIDSGPDFRHQALKYGITALDAVFITHEHYDHVSGLDDLRPLMFSVNRAMPLYTGARILKDIQLRYHYAFSPSAYPGAPHFDQQIIEPYENATIGDIKVQAIRSIHGNLPILGYYINNQIAYLTDTSKIPDETLRVIKDVPILIIDMLRRKPHHSHNHMDQALAYAETIGAKKTYLIHMSHLLGPVEEWESELPINVHASYDGLKLSF